MSSKLIDSKKRLHAAKVLKQLSQKGERQESTIGTGKSSTRSSVRSTNSSDELKDQYEIIRKDLLKLRDDLTKGYDLAKNLLNRKTLMRELLKSK